MVIAKPRRAASLGVAVALLLGGCGLGAPAPGAGMAGRAQRICRETSSDYQRLADDLGRAPSASARQGLLQRLADRLREGREQLAALRPPPDQRRAYASFLGDLDRLAAGLGDERAAAGRHDGAGLRAAAGRLRSANASAYQDAARVPAITGCVPGQDAAG